MKIDHIDKTTGEVFKPYESPEHLKIKDIIKEQIQYVHRTLKDSNDPDKFARLDPDTMSLSLVELAAMYESLSKWLADEKLHIADLKTAYEIDFANQYCKLKSINSETNETARMKAKIMCADSEKELNMHKHGYDIIVAWKKSIARYHDSIRSQLSYEKSMGMMSR